MTMRAARTDRQAVRDRRIRRLRAACGIAALALLGAGGVALAAPQSGIVRPAYEPTSPSVKLGAELFAGNCSTCHGVNGEGITKPRRGAGFVLGAGPSLHGVGARAADFYLRTGFMPLSNIDAEPGRERVLFTDKEIRSLIMYVASLAPGPGIPNPDPAAGNMAQGFKLFIDHCSGCHQAAAEGGYVTNARVPPLQSATPTEIAEAVRIGPYLMPKFPASQISDGQLNSIIAFVRSTGKHYSNKGGWRIGNLGPAPEGMIAWLAAIVLAICCMGLGRRLHS